MILFEMELQRSRNYKDIFQSFCQLSSRNDSTSFCSDNPSSRDVLSVFPLICIHHRKKKMKPGVNFTNVLQAAFICTDPNSAKKTVKSSSFFHFWDLRA